MPKINKKMARFSKQPHNPKHQRTLQITRIYISLFPTAKVWISK
jgi:hypothetical protein